MQRLKDFINAAAIGLGAPGLALLAFVDSSFIPLPDLPDLLLMKLVIDNPSSAIYCAVMATVGSVAGWFVIYSLARKGGEAFLLRRVNPKTIDRVSAALRKYGIFTLIVPSILPPPMPFKPFVLMAGVAQVPRSTLVLALTIGRGFRYSVEAYLAYHYGAAATEYIKQNLGWLSVTFAVFVAVIGVAVLVWRSKRSRSSV